MNHIFTIDGKSYDIGVVFLRRKASVRETNNSGMAKSGRMFRDIIGTYYDYELTFGRSSLSQADYDELYETLTAPVDFHTVVFPYGGSTLTFNAYITSATDELQRAGQENRWVDLTISFLATSPERRPL